MNTWTLHDINDIRFEDVPIPEIKEHEVLLNVKAAGICGSDIPRIYQTGAHRHPIIPGHEFAGVITEVYDREDQPLIGKRVGVFPLIPCGTCPACLNRSYQLCRNYNYLGSRCDGAFAEYVAVPKKNLIGLPADVSYEAAAMLEPLAVAAHAMRQARPKASDTVLVIGLGTIGLLLCMVLMEAGVQPILVVGNKEFQRHKISQIGIHSDHYCDSSFEDIAGWVRERTGGLGADIIFECVGRNETYRTSVECAGIRGRIILIGNPHADMSLNKDIYWKILRNELTIQGSWNSQFAVKFQEDKPPKGAQADWFVSRMHSVLSEPKPKAQDEVSTPPCSDEDTDDWHYVLDRLATKRIRPEHIISHRLSLEQLETGLHIMRDKSEDYGKIMVTTL